MCLTEILVDGKLYQNVFFFNSACHVVLPLCVEIQGICLKHQPNDGIGHVSLTYGSII